MDYPGDWQASRSGVPGWLVVKGAGREGHAYLLVPEGLAQEIDGDFEAALEQIFYGEFDGRRRKRMQVKIIGE